MPLEIALVNPVGFRSLSEAGPHLGLACLAGACRRAGHRVRVFDLNHPLSGGEEERAGAIADWKPSIVGLTVTSFNAQAARRFALRLRALLPDAFIIAGGVHATLAAGRFLASCKAFDCVCIGEGEQTLVDLADCIEAGGDPGKVPGLAFREGGGISLSPRREPADLDALAPPDFDVFEPPPDLSAWYPLITSRGCPHSCSFCVSKTFWRRRLRARSAAAVAAEVESAVERYGSQSIRIYDDNFALDRERAIAICKSLGRSAPGKAVSLVNGLRADSVDDALVAALVEAGLDFAMIGVEDGHPETFERIGKGETLQDIERAVGVFKRHGVRVEGTMVIGLEGSTYRTTMRSLSFLEDLGISGHWIIAVPFVGTELLRYAAAHGRLLADPWEGFDRSMVDYPPLVAFETPEFPRGQRLAAYEKTNLLCGNYHFLAGAGEDLASAARRIVGTAARIDGANVARHAAAVAAEFGLPPEEVERLTRCAEVPVP